VAMNIVLAWTLITATLMIGIAAPEKNDDGLPVANARLMVTDVAKKGPAEVSGIAGGDYLIALSDGRDTVSAASPDAVSGFIGPREGKPITVTYEHDGKEMKATMLPVSGISEKGAAIGIYMDMIGTLKLPLDQAIFHGAVKTWAMTKFIAAGVFSFIEEAVGGHANMEEVTGPVGIVKAVGVASHAGLANLLFFTALISINLAIINILPFPALDGGRLLFILIEGIIRRAIPTRVTNYLNFAGFALLMLLMVFVTYHDVVKFF